MKFSPTEMERNTYMKTIKGVASSAIIFNTNSKGHSIDDYALAQIKNLCDNPAFTGCKIRIMPDVHPGKVGTIGFTSTLGNQVIPNVIGIDIGCGMTLAKIKGKVKEFQRLDTVIRENVPSGFTIRTKPHHKALDFDLSSLYCYRHIQEEKSLLSLGTLGSGNHFIEVDCDDEKNYYLVIHSGSRHLGFEVTEHYLREGQKELKNKGIDVPYELTYLTGTLMEQYLHDLAIVQDFATLNREIMISVICKEMKWKILDSYSCIHNYIDTSTDTPIIRKGAIYNSSSILLSDSSRRSGGAGVACDGNARNGCRSGSEHNDVHERRCRINSPHMIELIPVQPLGIEDLSELVENVVHLYPVLIHHNRVNSTERRIESTIHSDFVGLIVRVVCQQHFQPVNFTLIEGETVNSDMPAEPVCAVDIERYWEWLEGCLTLVGNLHSNLATGYLLDEECTAFQYVEGVIRVATALVAEASVS